MNPVSISNFQQTLEQLPHNGRFLIAYSGGMDSSVLLALCAQLQAASNNTYQFRALHINHQLQTDSGQWAEFCSAQCQQLAIPCIVEQVIVNSAGFSLEHAARNARRTAFQQQLSANETLLTAHHLNDQAETVLLRLFRGSGVTGLAAMQHSSRFEPGWLARPLLQFSRQQLAHYAEQHALQWIEDPSNQQLNFDRNFLRHSIIPQLEQHWPSLQTTLARNTSHFADADATLGTLAQQLLTPIQEADGSLCIRQLQMHNDAMQNLLLREWLHEHGCQMPDSAFIQRIKSELMHAKAERLPWLPYENREIRRYRSRLYLEMPLTAFNSQQIIQWQDHLAVQSIPGVGNIATTPSSGTKGICAQRWRAAKHKTIRFRQGGERCQPVGRNAHHTLKNLFQEAGIKPWLRERIPLIYLDEHLAAVGDLWISAEFAADPEQTAIAIQITDLQANPAD